MALHPQVLWAIQPGHRDPRKGRWKGHLQRELEAACTCMVLFLRTRDGPDRGSVGEGSPFLLLGGQRKIGSPGSVDATAQQIWPEPRGKQSRGVGTGCWGQGRRLQENTWGTGAQATCSSPCLHMQSTCALQFPGGAVTAPREEGTPTIMTSLGQERGPCSGEVCTEGPGMEEPCREGKAGPSGRA